jgi:hypothetical protein
MASFVEDDADLLIQGKRTFIKDMAKSLMPPLGKPVSVLRTQSLQHFDEETVALPMSMDIQHTS